MTGWLRHFASPRNLKRLLYENSLALVLFLLFLLCLIGQILSGHQEYNSERAEHGKSQLSRLSYISSSHAIEATFENWESEFLQMAALVILSVYLRQKGATDSHKLKRRKHRSAAPITRQAEAPWPVRKGGWALRLYKHSLSLSLFALFFLSFALHAAGSRQLYNDDQVRQGENTVTLFQYLGTSRFWFESFQNWQSEFLSVGVLLVLSIFLRESGSPQSKRVEAPHFETGSQSPAN